MVELTHIQEKVLRRVAADPDYWVSVNHKTAERLYDMGLLHYKGGTFTRAGLKLTDAGRAWLAEKEKKHDRT